MAGHQVGCRPPPAAFGGADEAGRVRLARRADRNHVGRDDGAAPAPAGRTRRTAGSVSGRTTPTSGERLRAGRRGAAERLRAAFTELRRAPFVLDSAYSFAELVPELPDGTVASVIAFLPVIDVEDRLGRVPRSQAAAREASTRGRGRGGHRRPGRRALPPFRRRAPPPHQRRGVGRTCSRRPASPGSTSRPVSSRRPAGRRGTRSCSRPSSPAPSRDRTDR